MVEVVVAVVGVAHAGDVNVNVNVNVSVRALRRKRTAVQRMARIQMMEKSWALALYLHHSFGLLAAGKWN